MESNRLNYLGKISLAVDSISLKKIPDCPKLFLSVRNIGNFACTLIDCYFCRLFLRILKIVETIDKSINGIFSESIYFISYSGADNSIDA